MLWRSSFGGCDTLRVWISCERFATDNQGLRRLIDDLSSYRWIFYIRIAIGKASALLLSLVGCHLYPFSFLQQNIEVSISHDVIPSYLSYNSLASKVDEPFPVEQEHSQPCDLPARATQRQDAYCCGVIRNMAYRQYRNSDGSWKGW